MYIHYDELESRGELTIAQMGKILGIARCTMLKYIQSGIVNAVLNDSGFWVVTKEEQERLKKLFHIGEKVYLVSEVSKKLKIRKSTLTYLCREQEIESYMLPTGKYVITEEGIGKLRQKQRFGKKIIMWRG